MISAASDDEATTLMVLHVGDYIPSARKLAPGGPDTITRTLPGALKKNSPKALALGEFFQWFDFYLELMLITAGVLKHAQTRGHGRERGAAAMMSSRKDMYICAMVKIISTYISAWCTVRTA